MFTTTAALLIAFTPLPPCHTPDLAPPAPAPAVESLQELYESGEVFADFLASADSRKALWNDNYGSGVVAAETADRARRIPGTWRILAIAVAGCSDSVNTIPYLARLAEAVGGIDMRIVDSRAGRALMEARPTPDGRAATPTVLVLDEDYEEVGCWIERPSPLQQWALGEGKELEPREFMRNKMSWYAEDAGGTTVSEVVDVIAAAARGERLCGS